MALHVALLEALTAPATAAVARHCAAADAPLHLIGPLQFSTDDPALRDESGGSAPVDMWVHRGWRDFRDAMSRERCLYFGTEGERDARDAPYRPNSVLVFGDEAGSMPERIREKYPERLFRLPVPGRRKTVVLADAVAAVLEIAAPRISDAPARPPRKRRHR